MKNQIHNSDTEVELLRILLDREQLERKAIQTELHRRKGDLNLIQFTLYHMENDAKKGKFNSNNAIQIQNTINNFVDGIRPLMTQIFSPMIKLSGLHAGLKDIIPFCRDKHSADLTISFDLNEAKSKADVLTQLGVYKICLETVQYLCITGHKEIIINIFPNGTDLVVDLIGMSQGKIVKDLPAVLCASVFEIDCITLLFD